MIEREVGNYIDNIQNDETLSGIIDRMRDYSFDLLDHSIKVGIVSVALGRCVRERTYDIFLSGLLHDYGKLYIHRDILDKPGELTVKERCIIMQHSFFGYVALKRVNTIPERVLLGVLDHHERMDGSGYSIGKRAKDISKYGRIVSVADVYCAMRYPRSYRPQQFTINQIKDEISNNMNTQFDPGIAKKFLQLDIDAIEEMTNSIIKDLTRNFEPQYQPG